MDNCKSLPTIIRMCMFVYLEFLLFAGKLSFSYNQELPLKSTVSAVAFHPSEQMAVFSAYGPHESIVVLVHKVDHSEMPTRNREKRVKSAASKNIKTSLKASVKLSEIARTLNNITAFTHPS